MLELTSLDPVVSKGCSLGVPSQWRSTVTGTVLVMGIEDDLLFGCRKEVAFDNRAGANITTLELVSSDLAGCGADLGGGRGGKERDGGDKDGGELDHGGVRWDGLVWGLL